MGLMTVIQRPKEWDMKTCPVIRDICGKTNCLWYWNNEGEGICAINLLVMRKLEEKKTRLGLQ